MSSTADVLLSDGALAVVRTLEPGDGPALHDLHERASDEALWLRFFSVSRGTAHRYVDHVLTSPGTIALIAEIDGRIAALGTAEPIGEELCEVAFLVSDEHRGRGLGTLLLEHLAAEARDRGVRHFEARVFRSNHRMLEVFADAGFQVDRRYEGDEEVVRMDTVVTPAIQAAADRREFAAERRSLAPLLNPDGCRGLRRAPGRVRHRWCRGDGDQGRRVRRRVDRRPSERSRGAGRLGVLDGPRGSAADRPGM